MRTNHRPAVGRDDDDASNALQSFCQHTSVRRHVECYAGQPDAVEIAFQHRRHAVPPHWINQHDGFVRSGWWAYLPEPSLPPSYDIQKAMIMATMASVREMPSTQRTTPVVGLAGFQSRF
jgi:hypothetical protein